MHPSVAGYFKASSEYSAAVAFTGGGLADGPQDGIRLWFTNDNAIVSVTNEASADFPSLDLRKMSYIPEPHYMLAWQQESDIHYLEFERDDDSGENINVSQQSILTEEYTELLDNRHPSIATERELNNDVVFVAWEARRGMSPEDGGSATPHVVCVAEKLWNGWQPLDIYTMNSEGDHNPVVTAIPKSSGTGFDLSLIHI